MPIRTFIDNRIAIIWMKQCSKTTGTSILVRPGVEHSLWPAFVPANFAQTFAHSYYERRSSIPQVFPKSPIELIGSMLGSVFDLYRKHHFVKLPTNQTKFDDSALAFIFERSTEWFDKAALLIYMTARLEAVNYSQISYFPNVSVLQPSACCILKIEHEQKIGFWQLI